MKFYIQSSSSKYRIVHKLPMAAWHSGHLRLLLETKVMGSNLPGFRSLFLAVLLFAYIKLYVHMCVFEEK
jgi:hypothetical protein